MFKKIKKNLYDVQNQKKKKNEKLRGIVMPWSSISIYINTIKYF